MSVLLIGSFRFNSWVQCFSMQVVMNEYFLPNPEKNLAQIRLVVFEKNAKMMHFHSEKITSPSRRLGYFNYQLHCEQVQIQFQVSETMIFESLKLSFTLLTAF